MERERVCVMNAQCVCVWGERGRGERENKQRMDSIIDGGVG